jgi:hypothetical protein
VPRSPTTAGKAERLHRTLRAEVLGLLQTQLHTRTGGPASVSMTIDSALTTRLPVSLASIEMLTARRLKMSSVTAQHTVRP